MCMKCIQSGIVAMERATAGKAVPDAAEIAELIEQSCKELEEGNMVVAQMHGGRALPSEELATFRTGITEYTPEYWRDFIAIEDAARMIAGMYVRRPSMLALARAASIADDALEIREIARRADRGLAPLTLHAIRIDPAGPGSSGFGPAITQMHDAEVLH